MTSMTPNAMLENALDAINLGIEDYFSPDARRTVSAVRNFYAGVLLLLKTALEELSPELIYLRVRPERQGGNVVWKGRGNTVDVDEIMARWKSLGLKELNWKQLAHLRKLRNALEHRAPAATKEEMRSAVADTFLLVHEIAAHHLSREPAELLGATWQLMCQEASLHKALETQCRESRQKLAADLTAPASTIVVDQLYCADCSSELISVPDVHDDYPDTETRCKSCAAEATVGDLVEAWVKEHEQADAYVIAQGGESGYGECPNCDRETYSIEDDCCLLCQETRPYQRCWRCNCPLSLEEQHLEGACSYCDHMASKDD